MSRWYVCPECGKKHFGLERDLAPWTRRQGTMRRSRTWWPAHHADAEVTWHTRPRADRIARSWWREQRRPMRGMTSEERTIYVQADIPTLRRLHDKIDAAVFAAYGWPRDLTDDQILERLVALNAERTAEERAGLVRYLRPDFQAGQETAAQAHDDVDGEPADTAPAAQAKWPADLGERIRSVRDVLRDGVERTPKEIARTMRKAKAADVAYVLDAMATTGLVVRTSAGFRRAS